MFIMNLRYIIILNLNLKRFILILNIHHTKLITFYHYLNHMNIFNQVLFILKINNDHYYLLFIMFYFIMLKCHYFIIN